MNENGLAADVLYLSMSETLLGLAELAERLASLVDREQRPALLERAASNRATAARLFSLGVHVDEALD